MFLKLFTMNNINKNSNYKKNSILHLGILFLVLEILSSCSGSSGGSNFASTGNNATNQPAGSETPQSIKEIAVKKDQPIEFIPQFSSDVSNWTLSLAADSIVNELVTDVGVFRIIDPVKRKIFFTPKINSVGKVSVNIYVIDKSGHSRFQIVNISVGSVLNRIEPALAVRGIGCVSCHTQMSSNFVSDLGYSTNPSHNYYFNQNLYVQGNSPMTWDLGAFGNHGAIQPGNVLNPATWSTINFIADSNSKMIIPKINLPDMVSQRTGLTSLQSYFQSIFTQSDYLTTRTTPVDTYNFIEINSITDVRLKEVFKITDSTIIKFIADSQFSPALSGLNIDSNSKVFSSINSTLICDGDLFLDGTLYLENVKIQSINGCRIHATGSIFSHRGLISEAYNSQSLKHNIQLLSARTISLGGGQTQKNNTLCEATQSSGWYYDQMFKYGNQRNFSSLEYRLEDLVVYKGQLKNWPNLDTLKSLILEDANKIPVTLLDASCEPAGRVIEFSRIVMNAPWIMSRYTGNVNGSIIAEVALMSLANFKFKFDPIFKDTSVFPLLRENELLNIE